ncbi:unnamed protein product [Caenorhabditis angaria]|uniref:Uncharacterized protein n=1 Tax=Caenorhabditis angaria TaxID=860376 RepID=A0A9P1IZ08_9PELO|nr:unnamed protein product [Caenorhabditis angaria]
MTDQLLKQHEERMKKFEEYRKNELDEAVRVERILNEHIQKLENQYTELRQKHVIQITDEMKENAEILKNMGIEKIRAIEQIEETSIGVEALVGEMRITNEMSKNLKTNALSADVNLNNYARHFEELQKLAAKIEETLTQSLERRVTFELLRDQINEKHVLLSRFIVFDKADQYFEKRKEVSKTIVKQLDEVIPIFEPILEYIDHIENVEVRNSIVPLIETISTTMKQMVQLFLSLPKVEEAKYLENTIQEEMKSIESNVVRNILKSVHKELEN